ncbi:hypothetical protein DMUE_0785 [Dictyocoela muelleri]|nr:hypothetical protein DMUE_0785 [Dictyocoela muelleri]
MKLNFLFLTTILCYEFQRRFEYYNDPYIYINGKPILVRRFHPRVVITRDDRPIEPISHENSIYSKNNHEKIQSPDKKSTFMSNLKIKMKQFFESIRKEVSIIKVFTFILFSIIFIFIGYQIRKNEEHGNYVRLPSS